MYKDAEAMLERQGYEERFIIGIQYGRHDVMHKPIITVP